MAMRLYGFTGTGLNAVDQMSKRKGFALVIRGDSIFDCFLFETIKDAVAAKAFAKKNLCITGEGYVMREAKGNSVGHVTIIRDADVADYMEEDSELPLTDKIPEEDTLEWALYVQSHYSTDFFKPADLFRAGRLVERFNIKNKIYELVSGAYH